jgi:Family of unknown function (DUF6069)
MSLHMEAQQTQNVAERDVWKPRVLAVVISVLSALVVWAIARYAIGIVMRTPASGAQHGSVIGAGFVLITSLVAALAGWGLLAMLERLTSSPGKVWTAIAVVVFVLSLSAPWYGAGVSTSGRISLTMMHVIVAATLIPLLARTAGRRRMMP